MHSEEPMPGDFCIPNIGPRQRRRRMKIAIAAFVVGAGMTALLKATNTGGMPLRLVIFVPFWSGMLAAVEARRKTCVVLAARGVRNMDTGEERVADADALRQMRHQALSVHLRALLFAVMLTILVLAVTR